MALVLLALGLSAGGAAAVLCPSANHGGAFIGMASDTSSYTVTPAQDGRDDVAVRRDTNSYYVKVKLNPAQVWTLVDEAKPPPGGAVVHSFTGKYLQVLPDNGDNYNEVHSYESFVWTALEFRLKVPAADTYTLFVRWSGGDTGGAGDSMYATMANADGSVVRGRVDIHLFCDCVASMTWSSLVVSTQVRGVPTWRDQKVGIGDTPGMFSGCCYSMTTQACPCYTEDAATAEAACTADEGYWQTTADAVGFGATCVAGEGKMEQLAPEWYEFAGQEYGNVMDFASEPWDATCEAEGTGTADWGRDEAVWQLAAGNYVLKFYPREDGTALDAIYLAPFNARNPDSVVLAPGESSICADTSWPAGAASKSNDDDDAADGPGRAAVAVGVVLVLLVFALLAGLLFFTPRGRVFLERARGRRAEATPRSYFEMEGGPEPAGGLTVTTENKMLA